NVWLSSSSNRGTTWTAPVRVNSGATVGNANVFPWVAADANGHAVVAWLGDNMPGNSNDSSKLERTCSNGTNSCWAKWSVYAAETVTATARYRPSCNTRPAITSSITGPSRLGDSAA